MKQTPKTPSSLKANGGLNFAALFSPTEVECRTTITDRQALVQKLLERLALERGIGNVETALEVVLEREKEAPTLVAPGIAVPHARLAAVQNLTVAVATSEKGIPFGSKGELAKLILLILAPKDAPGAYLQALSSLARICADPATPDLVASFKTPQEVWRFFERGGMVLPDYICAGDIMTRTFVSLKENDTLEEAIDLFVRHGLVDLPVVDKDGDLVGVVTAYELLRVCLPDYILWMEDLSPILNFEPFAEILRNE
ncbi:MAG: PTS sugar transporter subunit IIA, partial [Planctomycetota bacterium]